MLKRINVADVARLKFFSHAVTVGDLIFVSGTLGMQAGKLELVTGGIEAETIQTLKNIERILGECGATLRDLVKVNVYLANEGDFDVMNNAYIRLVGEGAAPARITVGGVQLAFGAAVEIDCIAHRSRSS